MLATQEYQHIFKNGSMTYFNSSKFFPKRIRDKVTTLYAFVRIADDYVDQIPQDKAHFFELKDTFARARQHVASSSDVNSIHIEHDWSILKKVSYSQAILEVNEGFDPAWSDAFLTSMESDLTKSRYETIEETEEYIYGSANVIGLFMARMMKLPQEAYHAAEMLGKSMQFINFIRDIGEDLTLGRSYIPQDDLKEFGFAALNEESARAHPDNFQLLIQKQLGRYKTWQQEAEAGFHFIPKLLRIPIKTASDMYNWTARIIEEDPLIIFKRKVKPRKRRVLMAGVRNIFA